jgi:hypothetical protein
LYRRTGRPRNFCDQKCRQSDFRLSGVSYLQIDESAPKNEVNSRIFGPDFADRVCHVVAGPKLNPSVLHSVSVGAASVIAANNRTNAEHWNAACLIKRHSAPVNILGGYKFSAPPDIDLALAESPTLNRSPDLNPARGGAAP